MRSLYLAVALAIGCLGLPCLTPQKAEAHGRRLYGGFYGGLGGYGGLNRLWGF